MPWLAFVVLSTLPVPPSLTPSTAEAALEIYRLEAEIAAAEGERRVELLERRIALDDRDGGWFRLLADAQRALGRRGAAVAALRRAIERGAVGRANGECAIARWLANEAPEEAVAALERCLASGYRYSDALRQEPELQPLLTRGEVRALLGPVRPERCSGREGWRIDLDHLLGEIGRVHWRYRSRELPGETRRLAEELGSRLESFEDGRVIVEMQRVLASLGDGHSVLYPIGMRRGTLARLPLGLWLFDDGLFVVRAAPPLEALVGHRIESIGGVGVPQLLERLGSLASHDNPSGLRWVAPVYFTFPEYLAALGADLTLRLVSDGPGGRAETGPLAELARPVEPADLVLSLPPPPRVEAPLHLSDPHRRLLIESLEEGLVYARLNAIRDDGDRSLGAFAGELRAKLAALTDSALVIDLRHNAGGEAELLPELVRTLVEFDVRSGGGRIFVLTSRNTFSAAQTLVNDLERLTSATFVGEPPGTRPNRLGNEAPIRLPCSGAIGSLSSGYNQAATSRDERLWTAPDVPVRLTSDDYFAGRDPVLEVAVALARREPPRRR